MYGCQNRKSTGTRIDEVKVKHKEAILTCTCMQGCYVESVR